VLGTEIQAASFIHARVARGTVLNADEAGSWDHLHERFEVKCINHQEAYSLDGARTNWAEEFFSRLRRAEIGIHHHIAGPYLLRYAQESSWCEDILTDVVSGCTIPPGAACEIAIYTQHFEGLLLPRTILLRMRS